MGTMIIWIVIGTSIWVLLDARAIGIKRGQIKGLANMGPVGWFLASLGMWIIAFPLYLAKRNEFRRINQGLKIDENKELANKNKVTFSIAGIVIGIMILLFLVGFHIVTYSGGITLIPKEHLSFSETIVDVEDIIRQYNNRDFGQVLRGEGVNLYLIRKLEDKGIIVSTSRPIDSSYPSDTFDSSITKMKQAEAKQILKEIYVMEQSYRQEKDTYFPPSGTAIFQPGNAIADLGIEIMASARYSYTITGGTNTFTATAASSILDDDATYDTWTINQNGVLTCTSDDAVN
jgi:hypothetical protein